ncbi:transglycosylase domain-containing protein [Amphibiibacter pelophylacis]|uniref:Transglycosylase domain-containing protein n=1 Tax=Amphibiibacter pelophylacis TaxID=1799477 RepID=A0ACC6P2K2_9BURK
MMLARPGTLLLRWLLLMLVGGLLLQGYFALRIAMMRVSLPASTTVQRTELARIALDPQLPFHWSQERLGHAELPDNLRRAVIASEDAGFVSHGGVEWAALRQAWQRNQAAEARTERLNERRQASAERRHKPAPDPVEPKVVGGSTITQQLAKNLFLSGERNFLRKGQELVIALMLEALLDKSRILDIYLNSVEWGNGVFGAGAAAPHYFGRPAASLSLAQAATLAVLLPSPKRYGQNIASGFIRGRASLIARRSGAVAIPRD